jgi:pimeloyl-ACP methyl ester carboxylesterase
VSSFKNILNTKTLGALFAFVAACRAPTPTQDGAEAEHDEAALNEANFSGGFRPRNTPYGGFGGGACIATHPPVIFVHGNGSSASVWKASDSSGGPSTVQAFRAAGYNDCELFGLTWISAGGQLAPELVMLTRDNAGRVADFIEDVLAYTGQSHFDIVAWSIGVPASLHGMELGGLLGKLRRFVGIAGVLRGLHSCLATGPSNAAVPACGSQLWVDSDVFGLYPAGEATAMPFFPNPRMAPGGYRDLPADASLGGARFYTISAGESDEVLCPTGYGCATALFDATSNVVAQLDVGQGHPAMGLHDDIGGTGHFRARSDTAQIQVSMITSACTGATCCNGPACSAAEPPR